MTTAVESPFKSNNTASNMCGVTLMNNQVGEIVAQVMATKPNVTVTPLPSMMRVDAIGRMDFVYDEISEAAGEEPGDLADSHEVAVGTADHRQVLLVDLARVLPERRHLAPGNVDAFDRSLTDVEHESRTTEVVRRPVVEREVARAHQLAGTRFDVVPGQAPGHEHLRVDESVILCIGADLVNFGGTACLHVASPPTRTRRGGGASARALLPRRALAQCGRAARSRPSPARARGRW